MNHGVGYVSLSGAWQFELAKEIRAARIEIDLNLAGGACRNGLGAVAPETTGAQGQPEPPANSLTVNNVTIVPVERLTDEELAFYLALAEKGQALPPVTDVPSRSQ